MWKNTVELGRPQMILCPLRAGYLRLQYRHSGCVILFAFPLQQWLHEHTTMLRYTYIVCLANALFLSSFHMACTDSYDDWQMMACNESGSTPSPLY